MNSSPLVRHVPPINPTALPPASAIVWGPIMHLTDAQNRRLVRRVLLDRNGITCFTHIKIEPELERTAAGPPGVSTEYEEAPMNNIQDRMRGDTHDALSFDLHHSMEGEGIHEATVPEEADGENQIVHSPIGHLSPIPVYNSHSFS